MRKHIFIISALLACASTSHANPIHNPLFQTYHHPNAAHVVQGVSRDGDLVGLIDGTYWRVNYNDRITALGWRAGDTIMIAPNPAFFSNYTYSLQNITAGTFVLAELSIQPLIDSPYTHWITAINYAYKQVVLEDDSVWELQTSWTHDPIRKWCVGDFILIGSNDELYSHYENILINVSLNLNKYVKARIY